jgi:hypothetical protein
MITLIEPVSKETLKNEITPLMIIREFKGLQICILKAEEAPSVMTEIGRIREQEFRKAGAGRNLETDLDNLDFGENCYSQLIVWDPEQAEIVAAYRYIIAGDILHDLSSLRTSSLFRFTPTLVQDIFPHSMELGRSVVNQTSKRKFLGLFALWKGLGALLCEYPDLTYFFGNFTIYKTSTDSSTKAICDFLDFYHAPETTLLEPIIDGRVLFSENPFHLTGDYESDFQDLHKYVRSQESQIPKILLSYLSACRGLQYLGIAKDNDFGDAKECGILVSRKLFKSKTNDTLFKEYQSINPNRFKDLRKKR